VPALANI